MQRTRFIRFDWAAKHMLRNKADFVIFEGLISVLVGEKVTIVELLGFLPTILHCSERNIITFADT